MDLSSLNGSGQLTRLGAWTEELDTEFASWEKNSDSCVARLWIERGSGRVCFAQLWQLKCTSFSKRAGRNGRTAPSPQI